MTATATIQIKMIEALLAAIDTEDAKDNEQAIRAIKDLLREKE